ncbi:MAG: Na/Pi cotransporter family protein [Gammaproteobacteria bacterium]|nr:MAG: Na/Pi cotransporter family protein [Gammaproteobacteria bacterium]
MAMQLFGGLALFLFGMEQMADALKAVAGERMKTVLAKLTTNRFMGAITGAFVTAVIQSSSVTTVLVVGFISAGLMSMAQSIGVIMGANIGTTITAQIVAFKVTKAALLFIAVGFGMLFFSKRETVKQYGAMLMGLGLIFFGMSVMSGAMKPLRSFQPFLDLMASMENPLIGILVAAAFTALVQSSSATTGVVIVMASQGFVSLPAGIALAFGANIGTCVTAMLASIGKPREAVRAAVVHVLFNVFGVLVWVGFIGYLAEWVTALSPSYPELTGTARLGAETPRQIANAHTVFNIANTLIFIGLTGQFARLVEWLVPDKPIEEEEHVRPRYLDDELLATPSLAMEQVRQELLRIGKRVSELYEKSMPAFLKQDKNAIQDIVRINDQAEILHGHVIAFLGKINQRPLTKEQTIQALELMAIANDFAYICDLIESDAASMVDQCIELNARVSPATAKVLTSLHAKVLQALNGTVTALESEDTAAAQAVIDMKIEIQDMVDEAARHQAERLTADEPNRLEMYTLEVKIIEKLKRVYYFSKRISKHLAHQDEAEVILEEEEMPSVA